MNNKNRDSLEFFISKAKKTAEEQRASIKAIQENKYLPKNIDTDSLCNSSLDYANDCEKVATWLEELLEIKNSIDDFDKKYRLTNEYDIGEVIKIVSEISDKCLELSFSKHTNPRSDELDIFAYMGRLCNNIANWLKELRDFISIP